MEINIFAILWNAFLQQPIWIQAVLVLGVILRLGWPEVFAERSVAPRRRRRRYRDDW